MKFPTKEEIREKALSAKEFSDRTFAERFESENGEFLNKIKELIDSKSKNGASSVQIVGDKQLVKDPRGLKLISYLRLKGFSDAIAHEHIDGYKIRFTLY